jgi:hypothetical protein
MALQLPQFLDGLARNPLRGDMSNIRHQVEQEREEEIKRGRGKGNRGCDFEANRLSIELKISEDS